MAAARRWRRCLFSSDLTPLSVFIELDPAVCFSTPQTSLNDLQIRSVAPGARCRPVACAFNPSNFLNDLQVWKVALVRSVFQPSNFPE